MPTFYLIIDILQLISGRRHRHVRFLQCVLNEGAAAGAGNFVYNDMMIVLKIESKLEDVVI